MKILLKTALKAFHLIANTSVVCLPASHTVRNLNNAHLFHHAVKKKILTYRLHAADIRSLDWFNFICESCIMHRSAAFPVSGWRKGSRMPREIRLVRDNRDVF